ncbi:MAG: glycosyltransferase [Pseudolabrys sp.]|nr:glycosyltransferase [Pseudolabrys sp.]
MKVLYVGSSKGTSLHRCLALQRLGHHVETIDTFEAISNIPFARAWSFRTGAFGLSTIVASYLERQIGKKRYDVALIDGGELIAPAAVFRLKENVGVVACYNCDNPFVAWDYRRWRLFRESLPFYDLFVTPRQSNVESAHQVGAQKVIRVDFAADEIAHRPQPLGPIDYERFGADVVFIGQWMPERGPFLYRLLKKGVPLKVFGPRWHKAPEYSAIKAHVSPDFLAGNDYSKAVQCAKIAIGLLSKGNEDLHTTRSLEIPALGALFCGERTVDHLRMYRDGKEAVFWDDADECAAHCLSLLKNPGRIKSIASAGHRRVHENKAFNEPLMARIMREAIA